MCFILAGDKFVDGSRQSIDKQSVERCKVIMTVCMCTYACMRDCALAGGQYDCVYVHACMRV